LLQALYESFQRRDPMPCVIPGIMLIFPLPESVMYLLIEARDECGADEFQVVAAFLAWLGADADASDFDPDFIAMLRGQVAGQRSFRTLRKFMNERLGDE
jgi:hypothetical protein